MKKLLGLIILPLAFFLACDTGSSSDPGTNVDPGGNDLTLNSIKLEDADGTSWGDVMEITPGYLTLYTPEGYIVCVTWNGEIYGWGTLILYTDWYTSVAPLQLDVFYSQSVDCGGSFFIPSGSWENSHNYGKAVFEIPNLNNGKYYTFRDLDENNFIVDDPDFSKNYASSIENSYQATISNESGTLTSDSVLVFKEITRTGAGLPETFTLPLQIVSE